MIIGLCSLSGISAWGVPQHQKGENPEIKIIIDAGHGGHDAGAVDNGVKEKDINLGVARKLSKMIEKGLKGVKPILTREDDNFISLQERANIANRQRGDLFISIHTNSVDKKNPNRRNVSGASVYALGLDKDANNLQVAMRENSVIELESDYKEKYSGFDPSKDESYIIFEMAQKRNLAQSLKFADAAQRHLVADAGRNDRGVKQAGFWVLWATSMPAVLVELDFICNPDCAKFISSDAGQEKMATAIYNAVSEYFAARMNAQSGNSAKPVSKSNKKETAKTSKKRKQSKEISEKKVNEQNETNVNPTADDVDRSVPVLMTVEKGEGRRVSETPRKESRGREYSYADVNARNMTGKRRRRSESAKKMSDSRELACDSILMHSENEYLAKVESEEVSKQAVEQAVDHSKDSKAKGKKNKKRKDKRSAADVKTHKSLTGKRPNTSRPVTVYKIQILASAERLKENNPQFCGLKPVKAIHENDLYKYTYGESTDRAEMERLLQDVRKDIPDAFIITAMKSSGSK